jgi:hypothetical protein
VIATQPFEEGQQFQLVRQKGSRFELEFDPQYFDRLEESLKTGDPSSAGYSCLRAWGVLKDTGQKQKKNIVSPLYVSVPNGLDAVTTLNIYKTPDILFFVKQASQATIASVSPADTVGGEVVARQNVRSNKLEIALAPVTRKVEGCPIAGDFQEKTDKFLAGDELDRQARSQLYENWSTVHCYVWPIIAGLEKGVASLERSRAIKLLVNAIMNNSQMSDNAAYWQPNGDSRRDFSRSLPFLRGSDLKVIVDLLATDDDLIRAEAIRFVRTLPVDPITVMFRDKLQHLGSLPAQQRERFAIAASFHYYNRTVEWLYEKSPDTTKINQAVQLEFNEGQAWPKQILNNGAKAYEAMLHYARGIVEREKKLVVDLGKSSFQNMLGALAMTGEGYPSNYLHVAQALAVVHGGPSTQDILRQIHSVEPYPPATFLENDTSFRDAQFDLYAGPSDKVALSLKLDSKSGVRLLLRQGDWHLVHAPNRIGWIHQAAST